MVCAEAKDGSLFGAEEDNLIVSEVGHEFTTSSFSVAVSVEACTAASTVADPATEHSTAVPAANVTVAADIIIADVAPAEGMSSSVADADFDLDAEVDGLVGSVDVNQPIEGIVA